MPHEIVGDAKQQPREDVCRDHPSGRPGLVLAFPQVRLDLGATRVAE